MCRLKSGTCEHSAWLNAVFRELSRHGAVRCEGPRPGTRTKGNAFTIGCGISKAALRRR